MSLMLNAVAVSAALPAVHVEVADPDVALARRAAAMIGRREPDKKSEALVQELLAGLRTERLLRDTAGLNHWREHAPRYLAGLVKESRRQDRLRRYREAEEFFRAHGGKAMRCALAVVRNEALADGAVAETMRELIRGKTTVPGFFAALVCNARNLLEAESTRRRRFASMDDLSAFGRSGEDMDDNWSGAAPFDTPSHHREDHDPLDVLIEREDESRQAKWGEIERRDELEYALSVVRCRGNRDVLRAKWWRESALCALERRRHEAQTASARALGKRWSLKVAWETAPSPDM